MPAYFGRNITNVSAPTTLILPALNDLKRSIDLNITPTPLGRQDIPVNPQTYQLKKGGAQFLLFDSAVRDESRYDEAIRLLARNEHWFMDETCKLCLEIFYQIYTIHALINSQVFHCLFLLL